MPREVQLLGISNAIVDVLAHVDHAFVADIGAAPGSMTLIDEAQAKALYGRMGPATEKSGGSVANSVAGFALLGGAAAYIGKVKNDQLGEIFNHDMTSLGVDIRLEPASDGAPTARSHILITDDGQRTMQTYLGACTELAEADINDTTIGAPKVILIEGYVWDLPEGPALTRAAMRIGKQAGAAIALSLSDSFCVERHKAAFAEAVAGDVDIVVADEDEVAMLFGCDDFAATQAAAQAAGKLFAMTRGKQGSVIIQGDSVTPQAAQSIDNVVDTTGAGDAYAAGFLYGWANDWSHADAARLGTHVASNVIQQVGARFEAGLLDSFRR